MSKEEKEKKGAENPENAKKAETEKPQTGELKMDFSNFILSLNASAVMHLGDIPDPSTKERNVNLPAAQHTVEILEILQDKTKGNLSDEEQKLVDDALYSLRLRYVQATTPKEENKND
ncbi:DUF1844 domain-containing protein [Candidatus Mycalebacterium sp.]